MNLSERIATLRLVVGLLLCTIVAPTQAFPIIVDPPYPVVCKCVAVNPVTNKTYMIIGGTDLTVVDGATGNSKSLWNSTTSLAYPIAVAVNPVTNKVYLVNYSADTKANFVLVVDGATEASTTVATGLASIDVQVNSVTNRVYIVNSGGYQTRASEQHPPFQGSVTVLDGATNTTIGTVPTGSSSIAAGVNPVTNKIYVANYDSNDVTVIDGATNTATTVAAMNSPIDVAVNPSTDKIYVANYGSNAVTVIDGATNSTAAVASGIHPVELAVNQVTNAIYALNVGDERGGRGNVTVIDGATNATSTVPTWADPTGIAINSLTNKVYVVNSGWVAGNAYNLFSVTVIDGASNVPNTVATEMHPTAIGLNMTTNKIYVADILSIGTNLAGRNHITIIDGSISPSVVEFYNSKLDNYFITADPFEASAIDNGSAGLSWSRTGKLFKSGGNAAVCRFYGSQSPGPNSHFYTVNAAECAGLKQLQAITPVTEKRWNFESLDFLSTMPSSGTCPSGTTPVHRAYNNGYARGVDSNHRITIDPAAIQQAVSLGWIAEGVVMCAPI